MATTCENYLADINTAYDEAHWDLDTFLTPRKDWFYDNRLTHPFDTEWRTQIASLANDVEFILANLIHTNWNYYHPFRLPYFLTNCVGGDELTMQKLLDTIWESNKLESFHFVNYIDAMRASIWNITIYEEHLHEWFRHFSA